MNCRTHTRFWIASIAAPLVVSIIPITAVGQNSGAQMLYQFQAGQMMRFDVAHMEAGELSEGFYEVSVAEGSGGQVQLSVEAQVGDDACSTTSTVAPGGAGVGVQMMMSCFTLVPVAAALYAPTWTMFSS